MNNEPYIKCIYYCIDPRDKSGSPYGTCQLTQKRVWCWEYDCRKQKLYDYTNGKEVE